ncbi:MAG: hypothetical protein AAGJ54_06040 [Planctomycetota bacterium]
MHLLFGLLGAAIGGGIGAAIWAAIGYFTGYELGFIAWGIGVAAGIGMGAASGGRAGVPGGALAAVIALLSVAAGKYAVVEFAVGGIGGGSYSADEGIAAIADDIAHDREVAGEVVAWPNQDTAIETRDYYPSDIWAQAEREWMSVDPIFQDLARTYPGAASEGTRTQIVADELASRWQSEGRALNWPEGESVETAVFEEDYPSDLWAAAIAWRESMTPEQEAEFVREQYDVVMAQVNQQIAQYKNEAFFSTFGLFDLLWAGLAVMSAFKIGSSEGSETTA